MSEIKDIRLSTGLSQKEFAQKYHISIKSLQNWEQDRRTPPESTVYMLRKIVEEEKK